jgi:ADP-heptose:LPS heptosyltransferase
MSAWSGIAAAAARALKLLDAGGRDGDLPVAARLAGARTFLVLRYESALGSAINATVLFEALRRLKPNAHIAVVCGRLCFEVLKGNPFIDEFIVTADPREHFLRAVFEALRAVRWGRRRFDCLITSCDDRPRIETMALLLGRGLRIGHGPEGAFHVAFRETGQSSVISEHLRIAQVFGRVDTLAVPRVVFTPPDAAAARAKLIESGWDGAQPLFLFASQGSGGQPTEWYEDRFAIVADRLARQYRAAIVFAGSADQGRAIDRIRSAMHSPSINLAGLTTIGELSALVSMSDLMVTLDTGSMHLARGWGTPMVVIASAWQPVHQWLQPLIGDRVEILRRDHVPCALCAKFYCATRECLDEITTEDVIAAALRMLENFPPGTAHAISPNGRHSPGDPAVVQIQPT